MRDRWWTLVAPGYDRAVGLAGWHRWQRALVADVREGRILEVGCGPAHLALDLLSRGVTYVGVDRNPAMIERASRHLPSSGRPRWVILRADITALPFPPDSFDTVVAAGVLGLLELQARQVALQEMARVTRSTVRLLEPLHRPGMPVHATRSRLIALVRDRPIELSDLDEVGLRPQVRGGPILAGVYSMIDATKS